ncbi:50S ribosomal protein L6 [Buchnera aphidicola]|uniref:Large ribosomal subunit protein uL6 n=1 Tax=Buchnera aphidicola (Aphis gossypii) TaxID=98785 RepID=A0A5J6ZDK5_9GAMM|nr:50S ribosomal protein L6 [Buchnera aphidicola]QFQ32311.1 50S ribosomal protein L6 [Buchnera aphidicola (Aphis gossypii)]UPT14835.1 50S ribosomal protein L6 [Buchnera aphidicola (Aphis gossypii)]
MSRIAKCPIPIPKDVKVELNAQLISIQGKYGNLSRIIHRAVEVKYLNNVLTFSARLGFSDGWAQAGTSRALVCSMITGVSKKFSKKLQFSGVGYRVSITKDNIINMSLGYSHPILYSLPSSIEVEYVSSTEIIIKGVDKQLVGQVSANLRSYRKPEPYKGKGIRYSDEIVRVKEAKKK